MVIARGLELTKEGSLTRRSRRDGSIAALATTKRPSILYARSVSLTALMGCSLCKFHSLPPFTGDFLFAFVRGLELTKEGSLTRRSRRDGSIAALATTKRSSILHARSVSLTALMGCLSPLLTLNKKIPLSRGIFCLLSPEASNSRKKEV